jgi:hypothetical protein
MGATEELHVLDRRSAANPVRDDMVELDEAPLIASATIRSEEGASALVPQAHRSPYRRRDVPRASRLTPGRARTIRRRVLLSRQVRNEQLERAAEDLGQVPAGHHVPEQILRKPQILA